MRNFQKGDIVNILGQPKVKMTVRTDYDRVIADLERIGGVPEHIESKAGSVEVLWFNTRNELQGTVLRKDMVESTSPIE